MKINKTDSLKKVIEKIKSILDGEDYSETLFLEGLSDENKEDLKLWADNKTESYLLRELNKHYKDADLEEYKERYGKEVKYNLLIDLIDYSL